MAVIRKEIQVKRLGVGEKHVFDCMVESDEDFADAEMNEVGIGSLAYCLADGEVYVKLDTGWEEVQ